MGAALDSGAAGPVVTLRRREIVPLRIPMESGAYEAVIVVEHGDGLTGLGEAPVVPGRGGSVQALAAELGGEREPSSAAARFALETARLDLQAREQGRPLADLLGGRRRTGVECCALITATRPDLVAREAERKAAGGFSSFELNAVNGGGTLDQERLGAARWAAGRSGRLRLDFNGRLSATQAATRLPSLAPFRLELVEQPLPAAAAPEAWKATASAAGIPLAADESLADQALAEALADAGVGLAIKLAAVGGLRAAARLAARARGPFTFGSSFETGIGIAAALHLACSTRCEPLACAIATGRLLDDEIALGLTFEGQYLRLPEAPGLGVELDRRALDAYRLDR